MLLFSTLQHQISHSRWWCHIILYERCAVKPGVVVVRLHHVNCFLDFTKRVTICKFFFPMAWGQKCGLLYYNEQYSFHSFHFISCCCQSIYMCMNELCILHWNFSVTRWHLYRALLMAKLRHNQSSWIALQLEYETISSQLPTWNHFSVCSRMSSRSIQSTAPCKGQ